MPYCMYLRKSRADLEAEEQGEGETLSRHREALMSLSARLKLPISKEYHEVVSGETIAARTVMQKLLSDVEQGIWDGVFVMEVERLARGDTIDQGVVAQAFKLSHTKIITPLKTYDPADEFDEEYFEFGLFMSRREYKSINRRMQRGRVASVQEGKYVGSVAPYGYKRLKIDGQKGYTLAPISEEADVVKLIFRAYTEGIDPANGRLGVSKIVRYLNDMHIAPRKSDAWVNASVQGILDNPVYIGKIIWNRRKTKKASRNGEVIKTRPRAKPESYVLVDGLHEPIIDKDTWDRAHQYKAQRTSPVPRSRNLTNPLAGLVVCGLCGRKMIRRPYSRGIQPSIMCPVTSCSNVSSSFSLVEEAVLDALHNWLVEAKLEWNSIKTATDNGTAEKQKALHRIGAELETAKKQLDSLCDLLEKGVYSYERFAQRSKTLDDRILELQQKQRTLENDLNKSNADRQNLATLIPRAERVEQLYKLAQTPEEKHKLLSGVIEKVVYTKTNAGGRWDQEAAKSFEIVLYPRYEILPTT